MEKNFVIDRTEIDRVHATLSSHYGDKMNFTTENGVYDFNISFSDQNEFINLLENSYWKTDFPTSFITGASKLFVSPLYLFLNTNSSERGAEFLRVLSNVNKMFFEEEDD
ncbi:hypothetical protein [uncultured Nostoc sp.]|uniref:hypothetical protein n=1 Tax=uncultured Nostoc sp. TaxID=340711 RepID=UPI0035CB8D3E